jgi:hypothetical protein
MVSTAIYANEAVFCVSASLWFCAARRMRMSGPGTQLSVQSVRKPPPGPEIGMESGTSTGLYLQVIDFKRSEI